MGITIGQKADFDLAPAPLQVERGERAEEKSVLAVAKVVPLPSRVYPVVVRRTWIWWSRMISSFNNTMMAAVRFGVRVAAMMFSRCVLTVETSMCQRAAISFVV